MIEEKLSRYESPCTKYVYNPEEGDDERNIPPGTPLKNYPMTGSAPCARPRRSFSRSLRIRNHPPEGRWGRPAKRLNFKIRQQI